MIDIEFLRQVESEIAEKTRDLEVFSKARADIRARVLEVKDSKNVLTPLPNWSGTDAVLGSLDLAINAMERTIEELRQARTAVQKGRKFRVIEGDNGDQG